MSNPATKRRTRTNRGKRFGAGATLRVIPARGSQADGQGSEGTLFTLADDWRQEAEVVRARHGNETVARIFETCARDHSQHMEALLLCTVAKDEIAGITGYSARHIERLIKDGTITLNEHDEAPLLELPVKPGMLATLLGLDHGDPTE